MSKFNSEDLKALEKLARLKLDTNREVALTENIQKILGYMELLNEVDTHDTLPLTHVIKGMKAPLGKDEVSEHLPAEKFLRGAPARVGGFLKVPVVIEDKEDV
jgi:aspartyl-tRNA(Asn)/glutamyl-tRNA(Gln) amidotransferase subunit C